jgi:spore coat protein U-like protein
LSVDSLQIYYTKIKRDAAMKKLILAAALFTGVGISAWVAQAATTSGTFNVNVTLNSTCSLSAIAALDFNYTSFQVGAATATGGGFTISCTNTLPYSFGLNAGGTASPPGTATITVTDNVVNLQYTIATSAASGTGNGAAQSYNVTGTMASGQSGTCATASCTNATATNKTQTLNVTF